MRGSGTQSFKMISKVRGRGCPDPESGAQIRRLDFDINDLFDFSQNTDLEIQGLAFQILDLAPNRRLGSHLDF